VLVHAGFAIHKWDQSEVEELQAIRAATGVREAVS
jgi:hydrogenase maturation factor